MILKLIFQSKNYYLIIDAHDIKINFSIQGLYLINTAYDIKINFSIQRLLNEIARFR